MKQKQSQPKRKSYKVIAKRLAECVAFALKFLKCHGAMINIKTGEVRAWQEDFMDALDDFGFVVDRKKYWEQKKGRKSRGPGAGP
jgi:hypothetical protein